MISMRAGATTIVVAILVLSAGCSVGSSGASDDEQKGLVGVEVTYPTATAFALIGEGYAAVDGLSSSSDGRRLRIWITESGSRKSFEGPKGSAMAGAIAWVRGDEILVMGSLCPKWDREAANQFDEGSLEPLCGVEQTALYGLNWRKGTWRTVSTSLNGIGPKLGIPGPDLVGDVLVLGGDSGALLNTDTGDWKSLSGLPSGVGESCQRQDGSSVSVRLESKDGSSPVVVAPGGPPPSGDSAPVIRVYRLEGITWRHIGTYPQSDFGSFIGTVGCLDGAVVMRASSEDYKSTKLVTVRLDENKPIFESEPLPSTFGDNVNMKIDDNGTSLITSGQRVSENEMGPSTASFIFAKGKWQGFDLNLNLSQIRRCLVTDGGLVFLEIKEKQSQKSRLLMFKKLLIVPIIAIVSLVPGPPPNAAHRFFIR